MDPRFFPSIYGPSALRLGHKSMGKNSVRNLQYGPKTWLIRGIYLINSHYAAIIKSSSFRDARSLVNSNYILVAFSTVSHVVTYFSRIFIYYVLIL